jgi:hypothetical protein
MNARWVPFCVEVPAPANEEVDGTRNQNREVPKPLGSHPRNDASNQSIHPYLSLHALLEKGALCFTSPKNSEVPVNILLPVTACSRSTPFGIPSKYSVELFKEGGEGAGQEEIIDRHDNLTVARGRAAATGAG